MSRMVPEVRGMSRREIEALALSIIQRYQPEMLNCPQPFRVLDFFDHTMPIDFGLDTGVAKLGAGIEGMTFPNGTVLLSEETYIAACNEQGRARFTAAHECFHGIHHRSQITDILVHTGQLVLKRRSDIPTYRDPEWQANCFASALLMPSLAVQIAVERQGFAMVSALAIEFQVSFTAMEIRIAQLKV